MKRKIAVIAIFAVTLFAAGTVFAGGQKGGSAAASPLRLLRVDSKVQGWLNDFKVLYERKYPDRTLEYINVPQDEFSAKMRVMLSGGDSVDMIYNSFNENYISNAINGNTVDLTPYFQKDGIDYRRFNGIVDRFLIDGKIYGMPTNINVWQIYYNKDIFDKRGVPYPPADGRWTWDDYKNLIRKLTFKDERNQQVYGGWFMLWEACVQNIGVQSGKHTLVEKDYSFFKYPYELVIGMQKEGAIMPYSIIQANNMRFESAFINGTAATVYQGDWLASNLVATAKEQPIPFKWGVAMAPYPPDGKYGQVVGTSFTISINSNADHPDWAWDFLKMIPTEETSMLMASYGVFPAASNDRATSRALEVIGLPPEAKQAFWYDDFYFEMVVHPLIGPIDVILQEEHTLMMTESISVDQGIRELNTRVKPIWDEWESQRNKN
jgi:multiple sugar transport system substrate-binding protein